MKGNKKKVGRGRVGTIQSYNNKKKTHFLIYSHKNPNKHDRHRSKNGAPKWKQHCCSAASAFVMLIERSVRTENILDVSSVQKSKIKFWFLSFCNIYELGMIIHLHFTYIQTKQ